MSAYRERQFFANCRTRLKNILCIISPKLFSKYLFFRILRRNLDLANPKGMDEKLMWLKLHTYRDNELVTQCADKYKVRKYVADCGCEDTLNDLYAVWENPNEIEWDKLPNSFVIKCNHGCGYNLICKDKNSVDKSEAIVQIQAWYKENYWLKYAEIQYRNIPKRIICEKYIGDNLTDYKLYCFNGVPRFILVCIGRSDGKPSHTVGNDNPSYFFLDRNWKLYPYTKDGLNYMKGFNIPRPDHLEKMWETAEKLCKPFPFVRVDLYDAMGQVVFGELTFTPSSAMDTDRLPEVERYFGDLIDLSEEKE